MDVSSFMGGNFLTHLDLPDPAQVWTVRDVTQELIEDDRKVVAYFAEHQKGLGLNKVNLRTIAQLYTTDSAAWIGRQLEVFKDRTHFQGRVVDCIRVRTPTPAAPPTPSTPPPQAPVAYQKPVAAPLPQGAPVQQQTPAAPWEQDDNSPPSA